MSSPAARRQFARLTAALPHADIPEPTVALWLSMLDEQPADIAAAAVTQVIPTWRSPRWPTLAVFFAAVDDAHAVQHERDAAERAAGTPAIGQAYASREVTHYWINKCRETLAARRPPKPKPAAPLVPRQRRRDPIPVFDAFGGLLDTLDPTPDDQ